MQAPPSTIIPIAKIGPPSITRNSATAIAGIATSTRALSSERGLRAAARRDARRGRAGRRPGGAAAGWGRLGRRAPPGVCGPLAISGPPSPAESAPALGVLGEGLLERLAREVRPQLLAEDQLGVGRLPQQVVGEPSLAAGADDQVGIVHLGPIEACAELGFGGAGEAAGGIDDLGASAVVEGHEHRDAAVA